MEHFYQHLGENWFNYENFYKFIAEKFDSGKFVEVGSWKGKSASFLAVEIINSNKNIELFCVDPWFGGEQYGLPTSNGDSVYNEFINNIAPVSHVIKPIRMTSEDASKQFEDESLDFVFIDGLHDYESVKNDISYWYPKVKVGGIISGHDYCVGWGVIPAVDEWCTNNNYKIEVDGACWIHYKI
jgi:hypothetical protein